ncbi:MAG: hypothetical protein GY851_25805 [bacterium]|nr:hypothetical protein [bacterium]
MERRAQDDPDLQGRVEVARLPIMFAQLQLGYGSVDERRAIADEFLRIAEQESIWMLSEVDWRDDQVGNRDMYKAHLESALK